MFYELHLYGLPWAQISALRPFTVTLAISQVKYSLICWFLDVLLILNSTLLTMSTFCLGILATAQSLALWLFTYSSRQDYLSEITQYYLATLWLISSHYTSLSLRAQLGQPSQV